MRKFKLSIIIDDKNHEKNVLLSHFENSRSPTLTFNEQLEENEHDNYTFSFSVVSKISQNLDSSLEPQINLVKYLQMGRLLKLEVEGKEKYIKFIITSITPEENSQNIVYNISCQDYASYMFSKTGIGMEINTMEDEEYYRSGMQSNLFQISNYVLRKGGLQKINYPTGNVYNPQDTIPFSIAETANSSIVYTGPDASEFSKTIIWSRDYKIKNNYIIHDYVDFSLVSLKDFLDFDIQFPGGDIRYIKKTADMQRTRNGPNGEIIYNIYEIRLLDVKLLKSAYSELSISYTDGDNGIYNLPEIGYNPLFPSMYLVQINEYDKYIFNEGYITNYNEPVFYISVIYDGEKFIYKSATDVQINSVTSIKVFYELAFGSWKINNMSLLEKKINLDVSNSNVYNALIELANLTETYLKFDYEAKIINFIDKDSELNERNFYLSPEVNLSSLDLDYNINEFYTMLYVSGAEDEYGMNVGLTPTIPEEALRFFNIINDDSYTDNLKFGKDNNDNNSYYTRVLHDRTDDEPRWLENLNGEIYEENLKFAKIADNIPYLDNFIPNFDYYKSTNPSEYEAIMFYINKNLRMINIEYQYWIRKKYKAEFEIFDIENKILNQCEILLDGSKDNYVEENKKLNKEFYSGEGKFPFFQNMVKYKGESFLIEKLNKYIEDSIEMIKERDIAIKDLTDLKTLLQDLKNAPESLENTNKIRNAEVDIAGKQKDVDMYKAYVGNWEYNEYDNKITKKEVYGKYCHFIECFENNLENFNSDYQGEIIFKEYEKIKKEKEDFLFDFRKDYGEYLIEGFYENDSEFDPVKLYNQAKIYSTIHGQPTVDYSISYIDISDVIGKDLQKIQVGDIIKIPTKHLGILDKDSEIQVVSISSVLRNPGDIQLTVNRTDYKVIKKLLDSLQK